MARWHRLLISSGFLGALWFCAETSAQASPRIEAAIRAAEAAAEGSNTQAFVVAVLHEDEFVVRGWPKPLQGQSAAFALLDHTKLVQVLICVQLLAQRPELESTRIEIELLAARPGGRIGTGRTRVPLQRLLLRNSEFAPLHGPVAELVEDAGLPWNSFLVFDRAGYGARGTSVLESQLVCQWLEEQVGRSWAAQVAALLGPFEPGAERLRDARQLLLGLLTSETSAVPVHDRSPVAADLATADGLCLGPLRMHALLRLLREHAAKAPDDPAWSLVHPLQPGRHGSEFLCSYSQRGRLGTFLAVDRGWGVSITALADGPSVETIGNAMLDRIEHDPEVEAADWPNGAFGLGGRAVAAAPLPLPQWAKHRYSGVMQIGERTTSVSLRIEDRKRAELSFGGETDEREPSHMAIHANRLFLRVDASTDWIPAALRPAYRESCTCEITFEHVAGSLLGSLLFLDGPDRWDADNCLPGVISLGISR